MDPSKLYTKMRIEKIEVLVIGAGPAGSVASAYLNNNGHQVKVIEKTHFPRFVIGESLFSYLYV